MAENKTKLLFLKSAVLVFSLLIVASIFSPSVTVKAQSGNLAPYPGSFLSWGNTGYVTDGTFHGQTCTRVEYNPNYVAAIYGTFNGGAMSELNNNWHAITPGDRIVLSAWLYADPSTMTPPGTFYGIGGIRLGMDMYGDGGRICEIDSLTGLDGWTGSYSDPPVAGYYDPTVTWGTGWTHIVYDFTVPSTYLTDPNHGSGYSLNQNAVPTGFIGWISTDGDTAERANGYFYDTELYINPTSTPSPTTTASPTSTPNPTSISTVNVALSYYHTQGSIQMVSSPFPVTTTSDGKENYQYYTNTIISVRAIPATGYAFDHFTVTLASSSTPVTITSNPWVTSLDINCTVTVYFNPITVPTPALPSGDRVVTANVFNLILGQGESLNYQDVFNNNNLLFTAISNSLNGTATFYANNYGGMLSVLPYTSGSIRTISDIAINLYYNGVNASSSTFSYTNGNSFAISWSYTSAGIVVSSNYFFQSTTHTVNEVSGYDLTPVAGWSGTSITQNFTGEGTVEFGFTAWVIHSSGFPNEAIISNNPGNYPTAIMTRATDGAGMQSSTALASTYPLVINKNAIEVILYVRFNGGDWLPKAYFITDKLMNKQINSAFWTFNMYTQVTTVNGVTMATAYWGDQGHLSGIGGISLTVPTPQEIALATGMAGDFISMILYPFIYIISETLFLGMCLLFVGGNVYLRHKRPETILILFLLWGSMSGIGLAIPVLAYRIVYVLLLLIIAAVIYKVTR